MHKTLSRVSNWVKMGNASLLGGNTQEPNEKGVIEHKEGNTNTFRSGQGRINISIEAVLEWRWGWRKSLRQDF